jgi:hypothetical protein
MKKLISLIVVVVAAICAMSVTAFAAADTYPMPYYIVNNFTEEELRVYRSVREQMFKCEQGVTFSTTINPDEDKTDLLYKIQYMLQVHDPYLFNVKSLSGSYKIRKDRSGKYDVNLEAEYYFSKNNYKKIINKLISISDQINGKFSDKTSDTTKVKYIHDYIANRCVYTLDVDYNDSAYGAVILKKAKCDGYAEAFQLLAQRAGFDVVTAVSDGDPGHAWNKIKIGKSWYVVDVTYDDTSLEESIGIYWYDYFMIADSEYVEVETDEKFIKEVKATNTKNSYYEMRKLTVDSTDAALTKFKSLIKNSKDDNIHVALQFTSKKAYDAFLDYVEDADSSIFKKLGISTKSELYYVWIDEVYVFHFYIK